MIVRKVIALTRGSADGWFLEYQLALPIIPTSRKILIVDKFITHLHHVEKVHPFVPAMLIKLRTQGHIIGGTGIVQVYDPFGKFIEIIAPVSPSNDPAAGWSNWITKELPIIHVVELPKIPIP